MTAKLSARKRSLIQRFHIELKQSGMAKQKKEILDSFGVDSSKELAEKELEQIIANLKGDGDKWRKRLIASIFAWCKTINYEIDMNGVKAIACRASGYKRFNDIPVSRLRDVYYEFVKKAKTRKSTADFKQEVINYLETCN